MKCNETNAPGRRSTASGAVGGSKARFSGSAGFDESGYGNSPSMFVLDTNVLIYYAAGDPAVAAFLNLHQREVFYVPSIVALEFLSYPLITPAAVNTFRQFTSQTIIVNLDLSIAERAAEVRRAYRLQLADAVVAASALITNSILVTRNVRDFKPVRGLQLAAV